MKPKRKPTRPRLREESRFDTRPVPPAPFRGTAETELERLQRRLLEQALAEHTDPEMLAALRRASNEAAALAWSTSFPLLFLPELFREKARAARQYAAKQAALTGRAARVMGAAA